MVLLLEVDVRTHRWLAHGEATANEALGVLGVGLLERGLLKLCTTLSYENATDGVVARCSSKSAITGSANQQARATTDRHDSTFDAIALPFGPRTCLLSAGVPPLLAASAR